MAHSLLAQAWSSPAAGKQKWPARNPAILISRPSDMLLNQLEPETVDWTRGASDVPSLLLCLSPFQPSPNPWKISIVTRQSTLSSVIQPRALPISMLYWFHAICGDIYLVNRSL